MGTSPPRARLPFLSGHAYFRDLSAPPCNVKFLQHQSVRRSILGILIKLGYHPALRLSGVSVTAHWLVRRSDEFWQRALSSLHTS